VAGFISEWWPESNRNGGRHQIGIPGRIASEFAGMLVAAVTSDPLLHGACVCRALLALVSRCLATIPACAHVWPRWP
jgi:hypothetical protein